jgi:hypothetical protein
MASRKRSNQLNDDDDNPTIPPLHPINPVKPGWRLMAVSDNPSIPPIHLLHLSDDFVEAHAPFKKTKSGKTRKGKK